MLTAQVLVQYRGHRASFGRVLYGDGVQLDVNLARAIAAELRGRGHHAEVVERSGSSPSPFLPGQLLLFGTDKR